MSDESNERTTDSAIEKPIRIASGVDQDYNCSPYEWWCQTLSKCIPLNVSCDEMCHYNPSYGDNLENFTQINIPTYCKDRKECIIRLDICNLSSPSYDGCLISKEVCTNHLFMSRKCSNPSRSVQCEGHWMGQCILKSRWMDGIYDCLDRSDEPLEEELELASNPFEFHKYNLSECTTEDGQHGLFCEVEIREHTSCIPFSEWCKP